MPLESDWFTNIQIPLHLKKGERVFSEGDLFQRAYTLTKGECRLSQRGKVMYTIYPGDVFGYENNNKII
jgi:CRP-like cAMP-binding protein